MVTPCVSINALPSSIIQTKIGLVQTNNSEIRIIRRLYHWYSTFLLKQEEFHYFIIWKPFLGSQKLSNMVKIYSILSNYRESCSKNLWRNHIRQVFPFHVANHVHSSFWVLLCCGSSCGAVTRPGLHFCAWAGFFCFSEEFLILVQIWRPFRQQIVVCWTGLLTIFNNGKNARDPVRRSITVLSL